MKDMVAQSNLIKIKAVAPAISKNENENENVCHIGA